MTLIIAVQGENFVVVGADSRETVDVGGIRVEVNMAEKMFRLTDHAFILLSGEGAYAHTLISEFQTSIEGQTERGITQLTRDFARFCQREERLLTDVPAWSSYSMHSYLPNMGFVMGGLDKVGERFTRPRCWGLSSWRSYRPESGLQADGGGFALDGKWMVARYLFAHHYKPNMNVDELTTLVARCLFDTSRVDGDVGGNWRMAIILPDELRVKTHNEVEEIIDANELRW